MYIYILKSRDASKDIIGLYPFMTTCNSALASRRRFLPCCELSRGEEEKRGGDRRLSVGWKGRWRFLPAQRGSTFTARKDWNEGKKGGRKMARACFAAARNAHARSLVRISPPRRRVRVSSILTAVYRSVVTFQYWKLLNLRCYYTFV